jgi:hypothetical protein
MKIDFPIENLSEIETCALGEALRNSFFDQSKGYGCYSTFELRSDVYGNRDEIREDNECWKTASKIFNEYIIKMCYHWGGDGKLEFQFWKNWEFLFKLINDDCKKDYNWEIKYD